MQIAGNAAGLIRAGIEGAQRMNGLQRSVAETGAASDAAISALVGQHGKGDSLAANGLPVALDARVLSGLWSGNFGRTPYSTLVRPKDVEIEVARGFEDGAEKLRGAVAQVAGKILDPDGTSVGRFTRIVSWKPGRLPQVDHSFMKLNPSAQGTGFSREFNQHAYDRYERLGVERVHIHAALDVGGYAWARSGFELKANGAHSETGAMWMRAEGVRNLVQTAYNQRKITLDEAWELGDRLVNFDRQMPRDAIKSVQALAEHELGKKVLLGSDWHGNRPPVLPAS